MKAQLKSTFRRPLSAILLILLLGAVSFGFVSRTVEYLVVSEAVEETSKYYKSVGYLTTGNAAVGDVTEGARVLAESDLVAINDVQRFCTGTLQDIYNADLDGYFSRASGANASETMFWGELIDLEHRLPEMNENITQETYSLRFLIKERIYGYPEYTPEGTYVTLTYNQEEEKEDFKKAFDSLELNSIYGVRAYYSGENSFNAGMILQRALPDGEWFLSPKDEAVIERLKKADLVQDINRHNIRLITTKDMSAMPMTQETVKDGYLVDGRWLTAEDHENKNQVCVIQQMLAETRNLHVGDTLKVTVADEALGLGYYPAETTEEDLPKNTVQKNFKIVGIYNCVLSSESDATYQSLDVYIPDSAIPADYDIARKNLADGSVYEASYSFMLRSPEDEETFLKEYRDKIESMGYTLHMIENGWLAFSSAAEPILQSTAYSALMFLGAQIVTMILVAVLYFRQHRREFAISRALGISASKAIRGQMFPITLLGVLGIGAGCSFGWRYAFMQVQKTLVSLLEEGENAQIGLSSGIFLFLIIFSLTVLLAAVMINFLALSFYPVMEVLRESQKNLHLHKRKEMNSSIEPQFVDTDKNQKDSEAAERVEILHVSESNPLSGNDQTGMVRFVGHNLWRSRGSSVLVLTVALIFLLTLGWIMQSVQQTSQNIENMYQSILIDMEMIKSNGTLKIRKPGYIAGTMVDAVLDTGFVKESRLVVPDTESYLYDIHEEKRFSGFTLCGVTSTKMLNQKEMPGTFNSTEEKEGKAAITYLQGWEETLFSAEYAEELESYPVIVPEAMLKYFEVQLGEELLLESGSSRVPAIVVGSYTGAFTSNHMDGLKGKAVLIPLSLMKRLSSGTLYYSIAEFTLNPEKNQELTVLREVLKQIEQEDRNSLCDVTFRIWDEELRMTAEPMEQNLRLMKILFPIAQLVVMLAGGMVSLLLLLQNAKTAAILRVLGIPAKTVRWMLGAEKLLLGIVGSAAVTRKKPLELLQVKE